jgi:hypothetical protein
MSKTKAKAITRKPKVISVTNTTGSKPDQILLAKLMEQYALDPESSLSFVDIMKGLGMNDRNTGWRNAWRDIERRGYTEQAGDGAFFTTGFRPTPTGIELAATDEYKEAMAIGNTQPKTNEELHERIKGKLMNKRGEDIFDLLLEHGSLGRLELAAKLNISDTGAYFSYALRQLKDLGYVEVDPTVEGRKKKLRLSAKAFVTVPAAVSTKCHSDIKSASI